MDKREYDAVVVGSGPNGLAAAITLQQHGLSVLIVESASTVGGGLRTEELTLPGFKHDVCSAIHPLAVGSPFFERLPLSDHGLRFIYPEIAAAHPLDGGRAAVLQSGFETTALALGADGDTYRKIIGPVLRSWPSIKNDVLAPIRIPRHPFLMARFGVNAITSASYLAKRFKTVEGKALWGGMAAHSIQPLSNLVTSAIAIVLMTSAHTNGWPLALNGSSSIADALSSYFVSIGGRIETGFHVKSLAQLPSSHAVLFDITPRQLLGIAGHKFSSLYQQQLGKYRYGAGVFKIDWALDTPAPFTAREARRAGTIHLGNSFEEIEAYEKGIWHNRQDGKPFVLFTQPSVFDSTRAPHGKHTAWAYCHVPHGSSIDMTSAIEEQLERFAPGFKQTVLARHTFTADQMEAYNNNYVGGDINGGVLDIRQLFTRPALRWTPYRTSAKGLYICSSSTPPGGGVHGMCGYHAAQRALKDIFKISGS